MNKVVKILFGLVVFFASQSMVYSQAVTWQKWFDYKNFDSAASDAIQTFDGGYLILTNNFFTPSYSVLLIKVNFLGNIEWQKLIDDSLVGFGMSCFSISQAVDSGYIVSGYGSKAILFKTSSNGDLLWIKTYPRTGLETRFYNHKSTRDGGIIAVGDLYPPFKGRVVKTDNQGNVQWDSTYNYNLILSEIIQSSIDDCYYITNANIITKIDSTGRSIWSIPLNNIGGNIIQTNEGYIYTATGENDIYLNKFSSMGKIIWRKSYYPNSKCTGLCLSKDGNLLISGFQRKVFLYEIFALKIDLNGYEIYGKTITSFTGNYFALPRNVNSTNDSGFIFSGITDYPNTAMMRDNAFATKTDSACNAPKFVNINENQSILKPNSFELQQNYPNPFNPSTTIKFEIPKQGFVTLKIYDMLGKEVMTLVNGIKSVGNYEVEFSGNNSIVGSSSSGRLASGIYFYKLEVGDFNQIKKMVLLK